MRELKRYGLVILVAVSAALAATWFARTVIAPHEHEGGELHQLLHHKLDLDARQEARIEVLEAQFQGTRKALEAQLQEANAQLAAAITNEHQYGPHVAEAVDRSHKAMGELQKATLRHIFAMRAVLRPDQAARFDAEIAKTLTISSDK